MQRANSNTADLHAGQSFYHGGLLALPLRIPEAQLVAFPAPMDENISHRNIVTAIKVRQLR